MHRHALGPSVVVGLVLLAGAAAAATAGGELTIDPGQFEEFDLRMDAGWSLSYNWSADGNLSFNVHSHRDGRVDYHVEEGPTNGSAGSFEAPERQVYSLLWENRGDGPVALTWEADGQWIGPREHFEDESATPGPGAALAAGALLVVAWTWRRHRSW